MFRAATVGIPDPIPEEDYPDFSDTMRDFLSQCFVVDPTKRATIEQLMNVIFSFLTDKSMIL